MLAPARALPRCSVPARPARRLATVAPASAASLAPATASRLLVLAAFATIYLVWGSTYLAIRVALETLPPFLMGGIRFTAAGLLLYGVARLRGAAAPRLEHWRGAAVVGGLMLGVGCGGVNWAEQHLSSGFTALTFATVPMGVVAMEWALERRGRPRLSLMMGAVVGLLGIALLCSSASGSSAADASDQSRPVAGPAAQTTAGPVGRAAGLTGQAAAGPLRRAAGSAAHTTADPLGKSAGIPPFVTIVPLLAALAYAGGIVGSRRVTLPASLPLTCGMEMLVAGVGLLAVSGVAGETVGIPSLRSVGALLYLAVFGSILAFSALAWLLKRVSASVVSTYAYVNPVVAVLLGWLMLGEPVGPRTLVSCALILVAVAMMSVRARAR